MSKLKREVIRHSGPRVLSDQDVRELLRGERRRKSDRAIAAQALMLIGLVIVVVVLAVWA